ncbi:UNVERIFIED_CONTAM: hypothetical protein HDU68_007270 [Siphonaria sp. JEL0065]|nr:hypothetical protein HDU68_007270 [Siphonaria sp. JEL0065]
MPANFSDTVVLTGSANTAGLALSFLRTLLTDFFITARNSAKNPNLSFFLDFSDGSGTGSVFITILVIMFAVAINESAVDTAMNAMTDVITNIATVFGINLSLNVVSAIVLIVQVPIVFVAYLASSGTNILQIFLFNNQLSTSLFVPIAAGLIPSLNRVISTFSVLMAIATSISSVLILGTSMYGTLYDDLLPEEALSKVFFQSHLNLAQEILILWK